jgi:hypothetical protein
MRSRRMSRASLHYTYVGSERAGLGWTPCLLYMDDRLIGIYYSGLLSMVTMLSATFSSSLEPT